MIDRRTILAGIGGSVLSRAAWAQAPACASPQRFIDVHCHVFNAGDLPIEGFLNNVVIRGSHELNAQFVRYPEAFNILVHGMTNLLQRESPSPAAEIALVDAVDRGTRAAPTKSERDRRNLALLAQLIDDIWTKKIVRGLRVGNATVINAALDQLQRLLITQVYPEFFCCGGDQEQINRLDRTDLAARILLTNKVIGRYIRWALLYTRYRFEIADDLDKFHRGRVALMTPALVDFSKWVEDDRHNLAARKSYPDQVAEALCEVGYSADEIDAIMYRNAVRFLGLGTDQRERGTRGRLEKFYSDAGLPTDWLDKFNGVS
ncbi:MAG: hypothetical protein K2Z80_20095 [Xanthobacteraceae bacterium]|nr:hypothetical protein [Xanthobacteraceae bacterium]